MARCRFPLADNVYLKGLHIGSTYPTHSDTSVDSVAPDSRCGQPDGDPDGAMLPM